MASNTPSKIGVGLILLVVLIAVLIGVVFYYRKKYHKEKDHQLPTVSYKSEPTTLVGHDEIVEPHREFENRLYSHPVEMSEEERQLERLKIGGKLSELEDNSTSNTSSL